MIVFDWWHPFFGLCHFFISFFIRNKYSGKILFITENFVSHEKNKIDSFLTKMGLKNADSFLALSNAVVQELKKESGNRKL